jgi:hypothetical protein
MIIDEQERASNGATTEKEDARQISSKVLHLTNENLSQMEEPLKRGEAQRQREDPWEGSWRMVAEPQVTAGAPFSDGAEQIRRTLAQMKKKLAKAQEQLEDIQREHEQLKEIQRRRAQRKE